MQTNFKLNENNIIFSVNKQLKMNINTEIYIPNDSDVKLLSHIVDLMNLRCIERKNLTQGRKYIIPEDIFLKILVYGYMNKKYSSREIAYEI